jgi:DNA-binding transcriptional LysR family regulator
MPDFAVRASGHRTIAVHDDLMGTPDMRWFADLTGRAAVSMRSNTRYAQVAAAEAGMGLVCLARYLGDGTALIRLDPPTPPPVREIWLAVHRDTRHTPRIRALTEFLSGAFREKASILAPIDSRADSSPTA